MPPLWNYPTRLIFDSIISVSNCGHDTRPISGVIIHSIRDFDDKDKVADNVAAYGRLDFHLEYQYAEADRLATESSWQWTPGSWRKALSCSQPLYFKAGSLDISTKEYCSRQLPRLSTRVRVYQIAEANLATVSGKEDDIENGHISSLDEAEHFLREHGISHFQLQEMLDDPAKSRRIRRRVDMILLPLLCGTYALQYIDKQALGYSAVFDLFKNAHIDSNEYSWLASIFYFGYLFWEYPANLTAQRLPVGTVISCFVIAWGAILMITAACNNFIGMAICRFLLGCFEAPITPCFMMIVAMWYLRQEQPFRAGCFYCCNGIGSMLGGLISFAIGQLNGFPVWRAVFLICGGVTVLWGGILLLFLPNSILSAKRFTIEEKILLIGRGKQNQTGILNRSIKWYQIREALIDPQVWLAFLFVLLNETCNGGVANFGKLIIKGLVSSPLQATALGIPQGAFQVFFILSGTYLSSRFKNIRTIIMVIYLLPTVIGVCLLWQLPRTNHYGVLFGYYIIGSYVTSLVLCLQMPSSNTGGYTKRVTATALVFIAYCVGNIVGPHAFLAKEAPVYETGCKLILACALGEMACTVALRVLLTKRNKQRDAEGVDAPEGDADGQVLADLTDFENPRFRYVL